MNAIQKKRAEVLEQIAALRAKLTLLDELAAELGEPAGDPPPVPPAGKPTLRPARDPTDAPATPHRVVLLRLLAAHPEGLRVSDLVGRTGWGLPLVRHVLRNNPLFEKSDPDYLRSPWVLTAAGRTAAARDHLD